MKIGHTLAIIAACGFLSVTAAQAATSGQASMKDQQMTTGRSVHRNHHPAVVVHRRHHPHMLMHHQPHMPHHHPHM